MAEAFALEQTTLRLRLADEFEVLQAPDITALGSKGRENNLIGESGQTLKAIEEEK